MRRTNTLGARAGTAAAGAASSPAATRAAGARSTIVAAASLAAAAGLGDRLLDLALVLLLVLLVLGLRRGWTTERELLLGQLDVRHGVLERRRRALLVFLQGVGPEVDGLEPGGAVVRLARGGAVVGLAFGDAIVGLALGTAGGEVVHCGRNP